MQKELSKESRRLKIEEPQNVKLTSSDAKLRLLDVGSCYNPFKTISCCQCFGIDLCPADDQVQQCNFLEVNTFQDNSSSDEWFSSPVTNIPENYFNIVTFCLLLEYLPSPDLRLKACEIAWRVLKPNGILLIITPDSCHASAHSILMKKWKIALGNLGFVRFRIEKLKFLYCMAFRKTLYVEEYKKLPEFLCDEVPKIAIPQDTVDYIAKDRGNNCDKELASDEKDRENNGFMTLPSCELLKD